METETQEEEKWCDVAVLRAKEVYRDGVHVGVLMHGKLHTGVEFYYRAKLGQAFEIKYERKIEHIDSSVVQALAVERRHGRWRYLGLEIFFTAAIGQLMCDVPTGRRLLVYGLISALLVLRKFRAYFLCEPIVTSKAP